MVDSATTVLSVVETTSLDPELRARVERLHERAMMTLAPAAATDHLLTVVELYRLLERTTVHKVLAFVGGALAGAGLVTNDLEAVPAISPQFFALRYPEAYERGALWYAVAGIVDPDHRGRGILDALGVRAAQLIRRQRAEVLVWDACKLQFNMMERWIRSIVTAAFGIDIGVEELDRQVYMGMRLPQVEDDGVVIDLRPRIAPPPPPGSAPPPPGRPDLSGPT